MTDTDLVVVLPGIMGSTLAKDGKLVWAPSAGSVFRMLATFARSIKRLELPEGIGDEHPDDGVEPVTIMPDLHLLPGIWTPVKGYTPLTDRLVKIGYRPVTTNPGSPPGSLLVVPYDWRLSNRYNGRRLAVLVESALAKWRAQGGQFAEAKACFVCHSMGGLVARWYIAHGGAEITRKLITLGTPYRGAARTLDQLVNGVDKGIGPLSVDLTAFARSLPSSYQLLPSYACIDDDRELVTIAELGSIPELDTRRVADAVQLFTDLEAAEAAATGTIDIRHLVVGTRQTTATTARIVAGKVVILDTYQGNDLTGDGTVPAVAGPKGLPLNHATLHHIADKHGHLQRNRAALDEIEATLLAKPIVPKATTSKHPRVDVPELVQQDQPLSVSVTLDTRDAIKITVTDETGTVIAARTPKVVDGTANTAFTDLDPGAYTIDVTGVAVGAGIAPVSSTALIWSQEALARAGLEP